MPLGDDVIVYPAHGAGSAWEKYDERNRGFFETKDELSLRADMTKEEFVRNRWACTSAICFP